ncbi:MAG: site-specific DNA-methyltransferase [Atribacter sp.]|jgi:adenine-specific DNA-methyltransferase|uniref:site-specific DNA-methyltransferase n=1 Tax=Atribacter sp. TaxID=2847780 RepID=UPI003D99FF17
MAAINDLLRQIPDTSLRSRLEQEFARISKNKKFGLVFEEHIPECTPLYNVPIKRGSTVALKTGHINDVYTVLNLDGDNALCYNKSTGDTTNIPLADLVSVAQFGEPIFPTLQPIASVENAPDSSLWHTLIEADNYHALQLLEYLYPKQVDCIYIDPPYNTGARDWKYNNDYVDSTDSWRHSKWLSMMQKRLKIAKRILADDGVLIVTIDDNEQAHLTMLLNEIFPDRKLFPVPIQHNPRGTQGEKFAVTHETAIFVVSKTSEIYKKSHLGGEISNFRKWGNQSERSKTARATTFYPVIVDKELNIVKFGDVLPPDEHPAGANVKVGDFIYVYPIDSNGIERKWRYSKKNENEVLPFLKAIDNSGTIEIHIQRESENTKTIWTDPLYNAEEYGTKMINSMLDTTFSYPKSLYAVHDALWHVVSGKPNALIVDFFAGSGTTLHAVNLLNVEDNGNRRCILVTNNEVSEAESKALREKGYQPGDPEWEKHGICRSVTWPRTKYSILGKRDDGTILSGEYFTNQMVSKEVERSFYQLGFIDNPTELTTNAKKQLVSLLRGKDGKPQLPQSLVKAGSKFIVSDKHSATILFDVNAVDEWLEALEDQDHITDFYIVVKNASTFKEIKTRVSNLLGPINVTLQVKRPMSDGFPANVEYFKLGFLDKNSVSLGQQFREILPLLWLKSGAIGRRPEINSDEEPEMLILPQNGFAVLVDETKYAEFAEKISEEDNIKVVYFVTNSEEAFREMTAGIKIKNTYQLYRDYIDNFVLGSRRDS